MIGKEAINGFFKFDLAGGKQLRNYFRMVIDLVISTEVGVILFQCIMPMRTRTDYFFNTIAVHDPNIRLHKGLREVFIPAPHGRVGKDRAPGGIEPPIFSGRAAEMV